MAQEREEDTVWAYMNTDNVPLRVKYAFLAAYSDDKGWPPEYRVVLNASDMDLILKYFPLAWNMPFVEMETLGSRYDTPVRITRSEFEALVAMVAAERAMEA